MFKNKLCYFALLAALISTATSILVKKHNNRNPLYQKLNFNRASFIQAHQPPFRALNEHQHITENYRGYNSILPQKFNSFGDNYNSGNFHPIINPNWDSRNVKKISYIPFQYNENNADSIKNIVNRNEGQHIEILKSVGYALPVEMTFNHPVTYSKSYLMDITSTSPIDDLEETNNNNKNNVKDIKEKQNITSKYKEVKESKDNKDKINYPTIVNEDIKKSNELNLNKAQYVNNKNLTLLGLEKREDKILLLLPHQHESIQKRSTDSFNVNIGAGYGVGIDQNSPFLPESSMQINSTNPLSTILKNANIIIGKPIDATYIEEPKALRLRNDTEPSASFQREKKDPIKGVMNMKEIQQILHNVNDDSEYSKIVQVVKVPAVYEIHLEKVEKNHQKVPKQYIQQINNLATKKHNAFNKINNKNINIDQWRHKIPHNKKSSILNKTPSNQKVLSNRSVPLPSAVNKPQFREKKNTSFKRYNQNPYYQNYHPPNHQSSYRYDYTPYYPTYQQPSVYSTLTRNVPFAAKRRYIPRTDPDLIYGSNKEKVMNPEEINITIEPGTTMVSVPKLDDSNKRQFVENSNQSPCKQEHSQPEIIEPPEMKSESNVDHIYFTTLDPIGKDVASDRYGYIHHFNKIQRRSGFRPLKYMLFINKIESDSW